jgi:hypothetical protein
MKRGLLPHNPAALAAVPRHYASELPAARLDRSTLAFTPGLYWNDKVPDCTAVALANAARGYAWARTGADIVVQDRAVPSFYAACAGVADDFVSIVGSDGARLLDVLGRASRSGFNAGAQTAIVPTWGSIKAQARIELADAMINGALILGVNLSASDHTVGGTWDIDMPGVPAADQQPGSWGPHAVMVWDYAGLSDTDTVRIGTWGAWQRATWRWIFSRITEAYAVQFRQFGAAA